MANLHSLMLVKTGRQIGWKAPAECAEDASHYIAFVIPLDDNGAPFGSYNCEVVVAGNPALPPAPVPLLRKGQGQYSVRLADAEFWFHEKPGVDGKKWPYVGQLEHADFSRLLVELVPEDPCQLDQLCENCGLYIIACDPFVHYRKDGNPLSPISSMDGTSLVSGR